MANLMRQWRAQVQAVMPAHGAEAQLQASFQGRAAAPPQWEAQDWPMAEGQRPKRLELARPAGQAVLSPVYEIAMKSAQWRFAAVSP
jgi:hypothetical protein